MEKIKKIKRIVSLMVIFTMMLSMMAPFANIANAASALTVTYTGSIYSYNSSGGKPAENMHGTFSSSGEGMIYCAEHGIPTPMGDKVGNSMTLAMTEYTGTNTDLIKKILYYGYGGPEQWSGFSQGTYNSVYKLFSGNAAKSKSEACGRAVTAMALTKAYNAAGGSGRSYDVSGLSAFTDYIASKPVPSGFTIYLLSDGKSSTQDLFTWEYNPEGYLTLQKYAAEETSYSIAGAEYGVYTDSDCSNQISTLITNSRGKTDTLTLEARDYYVKEISAPYGFKIDPNVYQATVNSGETTTVRSTEQLAIGYAKIKKVADNPGLMTSGNPNYSLAGAQYGIYSDAACNHRVLTLTTDKNGNTDAKALNVDNYWAKEIKPSPGFDFDYTIYPIEVKPNETTTITSTEPLLGDPLEILLQKKDVGGNGDSPSLAGAEFTVNYYTEITHDVSGLTPEKTWIFKTDKNGMAAYDDYYKVGGDPLYYDKNGIPVGLIGTYEVYESKAPEGYVINDEHFIRTLEQTGQTLVYNEPVVPEYRKEFRIVFTKNDFDLNEPTAQGDATLAGAKFGVYHNGDLVDTYTTDENFSFTSKWYTCSDGWTMKELTPPEGYLHNSEEFEIDGTEAGKFTVRYNDVDVEFSDLVIKGKIGITKTLNGKDETGEYKPEKGAEFEVYLKSAGSYDKAEDYERDVITTNKDGYAETKGLPYGRYIVHQTKGVNGHAFVEDFEVVIDSDGEVYRYIVNNASYRADIRIEKVDAETGKTVKLAGTEFKIWDIEREKYVSFELNYPNPHTLDTFVTDKTGSVQLPESLRHGSYTLVEVKAPDGYVISDDRIPFVVDGKQEAISIKMENMPQKGTITIEKTGEVLTSWIKNDDGTYTPVFNTGAIAGTVFEIYADEDIITGDGTVRYEKGDKVATVTTGEDGKVVSPDLYLGGYVVKEKTATEGYVINPKNFKVSLTYAGQNVEVTNENVSVDNERQKVEIDLNKLVEDDKLFGYDGNADDIRFGLFAAEKITAADGSSIPVGGLIEKIGVEKGLKGFFTGKYYGEFESDLPLGSFYAQEVATNDGYILDDTKYPVDFEYAGQDVDTVHISVNDGEAIENELVRGDIVGHKATEDGNNLEGALIGLFKAGEKDFTEKTALMTDTSDENGAFGFYDVPYNKYIVREITAPSGCILNGKAYDVVIDEDGKEISIEMENEFQRGNLSIEKTGEILTSWTENDDGTYTPVYEIGGVSGAEFEVRAAEDIITPDKVVRHEKGDVIKTITTNDNGKAALGDLFLGKYEVEEVKAPYGHVLDDTVYTVEFKYAGQTVEIVTENIDVDNDRQKVEIDLRKSVEKDELFGYDGNADNMRFGLFVAEEISAADGTSILAGSMIEEIGVEEAEDIFSGKFTVDVPNGKYYVKEIAANEGYITNDTEYPVDFKYTDQNAALIHVSVNNGEVIKNDIIRGNIEGIKTDESGEPLEGALIGLFKKGETEFTEETALMTDVSDENGSFGFYDIPYGDYIVAEISQPDGYALTKEIYDVSIVENEGVINIEIVNETTKVEILKVDEDGKPLEGAVLQLLDKNGEVIYEWTTTDKPYRIEKLTVGETYTIHEKSAPAGYITFEDQSFTVADTGEVQKIEVKDDITKVEILKVDENGKPLEGAVLQLIDKDGEVIYEWTTTDKPYRIEKLTVGETYTLKETKAPEGYALAKEQLFTVKDTGEVQEFELSNVLMPVPKTGDETNAAAWFGIAALAGAGLLAGTRRKKNTKDTETV